MRKQWIIALLVAVFLLSTTDNFGQQTDMWSLVNFYKSDENQMSNISNSDSTCINDINRAQVDIGKGKITFCTPIGFMFGMIRFENELKQLVKEHNLLFENDYYSDVIFENSTQGCYCSIMAKHIEEKYAFDFRRRMYEQADSLFLARTVNNKKIVESYFCDIPPGPNDQGPIEYLYLKVQMDSIDSNIHIENEVYLNIDFTVELDGSLSDFQLLDNNLNANEHGNTLQQLKQYAFEIIKETGKWNPGQVKRQFVRTRQNGRIYFLPKK